jgi:NAD-reducing hydrogenase large subunit
MIKEKDYGGHIEPVTRIEGHGRVTIHLNEQAKWRIRFPRGRIPRPGEIQEGVHFEMTQITQRICGICP